jgi:S1-C subfamily serine protease
VLRENDVILSVDGIPVASDGNVLFRQNGRERVSFASYVQTKFTDEAVTLDLWRDGGPATVEVPLAMSKDLVPAH